MAKLLVCSFLLAILIAQIAYAEPLSVDSTPPGAFVMIDGAPLTKTDGTYARTPISSSMVAAGTHAMSVSKPGYYGVSKQIEMPAGGSLTESAVLDSPSLIIRVPIQKILPVASIETATINNAFDGRLDTYTWTTKLGYVGTGELAFVFPRTDNVFRVRIYKRRDQPSAPVIKDLTIQYTNDDVPSSTGNWKNVEMMESGYMGNELITGTVNAGGTVIGEQHHSPETGWASLSFKPVTATGLRIIFKQQPASASSNNNYMMYESEIYSMPQKEIGTSYELQVETPAPGAPVEITHKRSGKIFSGTYSSDGKLLSLFKTPTAIRKLPEVTGAKVIQHPFVANDAYIIKAAAPGFVPIKQDFTPDPAIAPRVDLAPPQAGILDVTSTPSDVFLSAEPAFDQYGNENLQASRGSGQYSLDEGSYTITAARPDPRPGQARKISIKQAKGYPDRPVGTAPIDGNTGTFTYTTAEWYSGEGQLMLTFPLTQVNRMRISKDSDSGYWNAPPVKNLIIQYTDDPAPGPFSVWRNVPSLQNGYKGIEYLYADVRPDGAVLNDRHDSWKLGWASLSFDTVSATGIRIVFRNPSNTGLTHYKVNEVELYNMAPNSDAMQAKPVVIQKGITTPISFQFEGKSYTLDIATEPAGADIFISQGKLEPGLQNFAGKSPLRNYQYFHDSFITEPFFTIKAVLDGYAPYVESIELTPDQTTYSRDIVLKRPAVFSVTTSPSDANIYLDERFIGTGTAANVPLSIAEHTLKVVRADRKTYIEKFTPIEGQSVSKSITLLALSKVRVETPQVPASVCMYTLSKAQIGCAIAPATFDKRVDGAIIKVQWPGQALPTVTSTNYEETLPDIPGGDVYTKVIDATKIPTFSIDSVPAGIPVFLDGKEVGLTKLDPQFIMPGEHKVRLAAAGFVDYEQSFVVEPETQYSGVITLARIPSPDTVCKLTLTSKTPGAAAYIGGNFAGALPIEELEVGPGTYKVRVVAPGYIERETEFTVEPGKPLVVGIDLARVPSPDDFVALGLSVPASFVLDADLAELAKRQAQRLIDSEILFQESMDKAKITDFDLYLSPSNTLVVYRDANILPKDADIAFITAAAAYHYPLADSITVHHYKRMGYMAAEPTRAISVRTSDALGYAESGSLDGYKMKWRSSPLLTRKGSKPFCYDYSVPCIAADPFDTLPSPLTNAGAAIHSSALYRSPGVRIDGELRYTPFEGARSCKQDVGLCRSLGEWTITDSSTTSSVLIGNDVTLRKDTALYSSLEPLRQVEDQAKKVTSFGRFIYAPYAELESGAEAMQLFEYYPGSAWQYRPWAIYPTEGVQTSGAIYTSKHPLLPRVDPFSCLTDPFEYSELLATAYVQHVGEAASRMEAAGRIAAGQNPLLQQNLVTGRVQDPFIAPGGYTFACIAGDESSYVQHVLRLFGDAVESKRAVDAQALVASAQISSFVAAHRALPSSIQEYFPKGAPQEVLAMQALAADSYDLLSGKRSRLESVLRSIMSAFDKLTFTAQEELIRGIVVRDDYEVYLKELLVNKHLERDVRTLNDLMLDEEIGQAETAYTLARANYRSSSGVMDAPALIRLNNTVENAAARLGVIETEEYRRWYLQPHPIGKTCTAPADCPQGAVCDVEGGGCIAKGTVCLTDKDCASGICDLEKMRCSDTGCANKKKDGDETGIDCGGSCAIDFNLGCPVLTEAGRSRCIVDIDCKSHLCEEGLCKTALALLEYSFAPGNSMTVEGVSASFSANLTAIGESPSTEVRSFEIEIDGVAIAPVAPSQPSVIQGIRIDRLGKGDHVLRVRALDAAGDQVDTESVFDFTSDPDLIYDYDHDMIIGYSDAKTLIGVIAGMVECPGSKVCDIDGDGFVNLADLSALYARMS